MPTTTKLNAYTLIGIGRAADLQGFTAPGYTEDAETALVVHGEYAAVVSPVALDDFTGDAGEKHMGDLNWIAPRATRHDEVLHAAITRGPILPVAFGSVFRTSQAIAATIAANKPAIDAFLEQTAGRVELAVRVAGDVEIAAKRAAEETPRLTATTTGAAYLKKRSQQHDASRKVGEYLRESATAAGHDLAGISNDARSRTPRSLDDGTTPIASWAFLINAERETDFRAAADTINEHRPELTLTVTGPWPCYSFAPALNAAA